ncbi:MAG TPA: AMP-binding protein, partial [Pyrinomonadaceae bacterium]|nr:AMP-binding protein [Pyrinomonadaceae bacterium]
MTSGNLIGFENIPQTLPHYCIESFRMNDKPDALAYKLGDAWHRISGAEAVEKLKRIAVGLSSLGVKAGDRIAIISENRPEWSLADLAILSLRAVNVPIYTTQAVEQIRYILENSGAKMLCISGKKLYKHAEEAIRSVERLEKLIFFDDDAIENVDPRSVTLDSVEKKGEEILDREPSAFDETLSTIETDDLATIIYTSGTTGEPKGVMLTHKNFVSNVDAISKGLPIIKNDRSLAVLPLSHIFERTVFYVLCSNGVSINYCASFDQLASHLQEVKPTIMTAVPRLYETMHQRILRDVRKLTGMRKWLFHKAVELGRKQYEQADSLTLWERLLNWLCEVSVRK